MLDVPLSIKDLHNTETQVQRSFNGKYINNLKRQVFDRCSFWRKQRIWSKPSL